jgi:hypothetical protein
VTSYLILGAGRFGRLAYKRLHSREPDAQICLVDHDPQKLSLLDKNPFLQTALAAAVSYLADSLASDNPPDWVIPAIPRHVAFDWLWLQRPAGEGWRQVPVPSAVGRDLPFLHRGTSGEVYLSLSKQQCPDDCPEPAERCFLTGVSREYYLYDYLAKFFHQDYISVVIRSRQLAPGVGGFRPSDLWQLQRQVLGNGQKILISTACRCHGVCHALGKLPAREAVVDI